LVVDTPVKLLNVKYAEGSFLWIVNNIYFQYYSLLITIISILVMIFVSLGTKEPDYEKIKGLTYGTRTEEDRKELRANRSRGDVIASVILVVLIVLCYIYFSG